jgi:hypothetical protein
VTGNNILDTDTPANAMVNSQASFTTAAAVLPTIASAASVGNTNISTVTVTFNKAVTAATAGNVANYGLNNGATVLSVATGTAATVTTVTLTTSILSHGTSYILTGNNIQDTDVPVNAMANSQATFTTAAAVAPAIASVSAGDANHVVVVYTKPVLASTAQNLANYVFNNGITASGAVLAANNLTLTLTTSTLTKGLTNSVTISNVQDLDTPPNTIAPNTVKTFALLDVPGLGLYWWLKADAVTLNGATVSSWNDSGPNNWPATQATVANQPTYVASNSAANNKPTISFNGTTNILATANNAVPLTGYADLTIFAVAAGSSATATIGGPNNHGGDDHTMLRFIENGGAWGNGLFNIVQQGVNVWYAAGTNHPNSAYNRTATAAWMVYDNTRDQTGAGLETWRINGATVATNPSFAGAPGSATILNENGGVNIGAWAGGSCWAGDIAEIIIYNRALSDSERQAVEAYLTAKYMAASGVTVAVTAPTTGSSATVNSTVTLVATASTTTAGATISNVTFLLDGAAFPTAAVFDAVSNTYTYAWNTTGVLAGAHSITARATDTVGGSAVSTPAVVINIITSVPPHVAITAPADGLVAGQGWVISVTTTCANGTPGVVSGVEFYLDNSKIPGGNGMHTTGSVWTYAWDTANTLFGTHTLMAKVTDNAGLTGSSNTLSIQIRIPADGNGDGIVDGLDYGTWQNGYMRPGSTFDTGDFNGDGVVDGLDYGTWQNNYMRTGSLDDVVAATVATSDAVAAMAPAASGAPKLVSATAGAASVALVFDSDVKVTAGAVEVNGLANGSQIGAATYDAATKTLTVTFASALPADFYTVRVIGNLVVGADSGVALDGGDATIEFSVE